MSKVPPKDSPLTIEDWDPARHDRSGFDCGVASLNNFLAQTAKKQQQHDMTKVYVAVTGGEVKILGYHAINVGIMNAVNLANKPRGTPTHGEIPVLFLSRVAVDQQVQGQGIGEILMHHVFEKACLIADEAGCYAVVLDVMSDGGDTAFAKRKKWYEEFGFHSFSKKPARMFMNMKEIRQLVTQA
ncbi:MAG: GNAT family N-acetyltransferase [Parvularculales bacterium]